MIPSGKWEKPNSNTDLIPTLILTDGSGAANENFIADTDTASLAGVDADGKRLQKRAFFQGHVIRQLVAEVGRVDVEARKGAVDRWSGAEADVGAEVVAPFSAKGAAGARNARLDCHAVAWV